MRPFLRGASPLLAVSLAACGTWKPPERGAASASPAGPGASPAAAAQPNPAVFGLATLPLRSYLAPDAGVDTAGVRQIAIQTPKGLFNVWTRRFGRNPRIKLLLLHGGPGATHEYFEALERHLGSEGIELIYYDQLGSAYSDQPTDDSLWTVERFVDELEQVRKALALTKEDFFLLGHSWGGIVAVEYALGHPDTLKGLVISNMMTSIPDYNRYADEVLAKGIDPAVVQELRELERRGQHDSPRYAALLLPNVHAKHVCRLDPWPDAVMRTFDKLNEQVSLSMKGPSGFGASGRLATWDRKADLPRLAMPTLVIGATHDTMDPEHMRWVSTQVQHGSFLLCPQGSHLAMWDDQLTYVTGLVRFLKEVDAGRTTVAF